MRNFQAFFAGCLLLILVAGCSGSVELFTKKELDEMYVLDISQSQKSLDRRFPIDSTKSIGLTIDVMAGAPPPSFVHVFLLNADDEELASITFAKKSGEPDQAEKFIVVDSFDDPLPPLILPPKLPSGYYILCTQILDQDSDVLSEVKSSLLVYDLSIPQMSISLYPAQLNAARPALFKAVFSGPITKDAWISWKIDDVAYAEGFVSDNFDRIIWTAPDNKGVHSISADFFPFKPFGEEQVLPLVTIEIKAPVVESVEPTVYSSLAKPYVSFDFNKGLDYKGSRVLSELSILGGKPYPEEFPNGYGFVLGEGSGMVSQNSMIPWIDGENGDFSILFSLAALSGSSQPLPAEDDNDRFLFRAFDSSDKLVLELGVSDKVPYVKTDVRVDAVSMIPNELSTLIFNFRSSEGFLELGIFINGALAGSGKVKDTRLEAVQGISEFAGTAGYKAVYNDFLVFDHVLPAFAVSMSAQYPDTLIRAISFMDAASPVSDSAKPSYVLSGKSSILKSQGLLLSSPKDGLSTDIPPETKKLKLALKTRTGIPAVSVLLSDGKSIQIKGNGDVLYLGKIQGRLELQSTNSTAQLIIEKQNDSVQVSNGFRESLLAIPGIKAAFTDIRINSAGSSALVLESLLMLNLPK